MVLYEWPVSWLEGKQSVRLSGQGIWIGDDILPWRDLTDVGFVRYQSRGGTNEILSLSFGNDNRRALRWTGSARARAPWRAMLLAFADMAQRQRPDLDLRDGPDAREQRAARYIGIAVAGSALAIMAMVCLLADGIWGVLAGLWIGVIGSAVGASVHGVYTRREEPPRLTWAGFAAREGQPGELPAN